MKLQVIRKEEVCVHREKLQVAIKREKGVENRKTHEVVQAVVQAMVTRRRSQRWWSSEEGIKEIGEKTVKHTKACVCMCACGIYVSHNNSCFSGFRRLFSDSFRCLRRLVEGSSGNDYISQMSDNILVMILFLLPAKDAVVTSSLSRRWRFLWCNLKDLKFDCNDTTLDNITRRAKYISRVNSVIRSYNRPTINGFHIHDDLNHGHRCIVDQWLQFAANKKVETLELDFMGYHGQIPIYDFPSHLSSNATLVSLERLLLKEVNVSDTILDQFLENSPLLETISIQGSRDLKHIRVGGRALNLKHFKIVKCHAVESIYLSDFDLVSFAFDGFQQIDLRLCNLPMLTNLEISRRNMGLGDYVFNQISSCASSLVVLSLIGLLSFTEKVNLNSVGELPNVKILSLTIGAHEDDSLIDVFTSIAEVCPNMMGLFAATIQPTVDEGSNAFW